MNDQSLLRLLKETGKPIPVPGKPGKVYIYSKKKDAVVETTVKRAASWQAIAATGKALQQKLSATAEAAYQESNLRENPMSRRKYDDEFFFEQYSQSPYGAQQAIPTARRNPDVMYTSKGQPYVLEMVNGKRRARFIKRNEIEAMESLDNPRRRKKRQASPQAVAAFKRAQEIMRAQGCSIQTALKQAWGEVRGSKAAANPYFDSTQTRSALVPAGFEWSDPTMTVTALEPMGRMNPDLSESDYWGGSNRKKGSFAHRLGQFSPLQTSGFQPVNRRNPDFEENPRGRRRKKRQASPQAVAAFQRAQAIMKAKGCSIQDALKQAWREVKAGKAVANPFYDPTQTRSALVPADYDWSDSTMTVTALEPMGRMNPGRASRAAERLAVRAQKAEAAGRPVRAARVQKVADRLAKWADRHQDYRTPALAPDDFYSPFSGASGVTLKDSTTLDGSSSSFFPHQGSAVYESGVSGSNEFEPELVPASVVQGERAVFAPGLRYDRDAAFAPDATGSVTDSDFWGGSLGRMGALNYRLGQFSTTQTSGFQPVNRRNPRRKK